MTGGNRTRPGGRVVASPLARRVARETGVDLATVLGTGPGGRIIRQDVQDAAGDPGAYEVENRPSDIVACMDVQIDALRNVSAHTGDLVDVETLAGRVVSAVEKSLAELDFVGLGRSSIRGSEPASSDVHGGHVVRLDRRGRADLHGDATAVVQCPDSSGLSSFVPVRPPHVAVALGVAAPQRRVVVEDDALGIRTMTTLTAVVSGSAMDVQTVAAWLDRVRHHTQNNEVPERQKRGRQ